MQTFTPADNDASLTSSTLQVYKKSSGPLTESLSLTKAGTSGPLTNEYVGSGFLQRTTRDSTNTEFTFDAFTYGVKTPDAALARSGTGVFAIDLIGAFAYGDANALVGEGMLQIDFASGEVTTQGLQRIVSNQDGSLSRPERFSGSAFLTSGSNGFSGSFGLDGFFQPLLGTMQGRFYGPAAQEVGAAWQASNAEGLVAAGTITGRRDPKSPGINQSLTNLRASEQFGGNRSYAAYSQKPDGTFVSNAVIESFREGSNFSYDADSGQFSYRDNAGQVTAFGANQKVAAESNARVTVYEVPSAPAGGRTRLTLYNAGPGNGELALTYASYGRWQSFQPPTSDGNRLVRNEYFTYGIKTDPLTMPRTGSARYEGLVFGTAVTDRPGEPIYALSGTSVFDLDFARLALTGTMGFSGRNVSTAEVREFGNMVAKGSLTRDGMIRASLFESSNSIDLRGSFLGQLFGPDAAELGASFQFRIRSNQLDPNSNPPFISFQGGTIAKRKR